MKMIGVVTLVFGLMIMTIPAQAEQSLLESVVTGCKEELTNYCSDVTPGQKRVLACLYAYNDKLSAKCDYALFDAAVQLERAVAALTYVVSECADDLAQFCSEETAGERRLLDCLNRNEADVSARCKEAVNDVGLK